jgi:hypothetical protein
MVTTMVHKELLCSRIVVQILDMMSKQAQTITYDHRTLRTRLPVRSAIFKQCTGGSVLRWVTTGESPLLYVFVFVFGVEFFRWSRLAVWVEWSGGGGAIDPPHFHQ